MTTRRPGGALASSSLLPVLRTDLPVVLQQVERVLREGWPDYADFLARHQEEVRRAGEAALEQFVLIAEQTRAAADDAPLRDQSQALTLFEEIGRAQWRAGNPLAMLLSAYQAGAQVAWRRFAKSAIDRGLPAGEVALLAEAVFAFVDGLTSASARGFVEEQTGAAQERERARTDLAELLLSDRSDSALVQGAAQRAGWLVPATIAVVLLDHGNPLAADAQRRLGLECLPLRGTGMFGVLLPDAGAPERRQRLLQVLRGCGAVVGPAVPPDRLPASLRVTVVAQRLQQEGVLVGDPVFVGDHLDAIIVHRDARLLEVLQAKVLEPFAALPADARQRLAETLASWLRQMGNQQDVAAELHVHRQTVRYRLAQLRELYGEQLDDPAFRLKLTLALAWSPLDPPA